MSCIVQKTDVKFCQVVNISYQLGLWIAKAPISSFHVVMARNPDQQAGIKSRKKAREQGNSSKQLQYHEPGLPEDKKPGTKSLAEVKDYLTRHRQEGKLILDTRRLQQI